MAESKFSKMLRDELKKLFSFEFIRIESHATSPGVPDVHWIHRPSGTTGWIETKFCKKMPKKVPYQPNQAPWLQSYAKAGGRACTLVYVEQHDLIVFVPGKESVAAAGDLASSLGYRTVALGEKGWAKALANLILAT